MQRKIDKIKTEADWLECGQAQTLLDYLGAKASKRKLRLFACACCRHGGQSLGDAVAEALELAEAFADGCATGAENERTAGALRTQAAAVWQALALEAFESARQTSRTLVDGVFQASKYSSEAAQAENAAHAGLLRDIFGNPFKKAAVDPAWLTSPVVKLVQDIYDHAAFEKLPKLADALEAAGCADADILGHCRQPGAHARGCWVVDLLNKEGGGPAPAKSKKDLEKLRKDLRARPPVKRAAAGAGAEVERAAGEQAWLAGADPEEMLRGLHAASDRQLRLFACACCRRVGRLTKEVNLQALAVAERYADQEANENDRRQATESIAGSDRDESSPSGSNHKAWSRYDAATAILRTITDDAFEAAKDGSEFAASAAGYAVAREGDEKWEAAQEAERAAQAGLLRDIFDNPYREIAADASWLTLAVLELAQEIYGERSFDKLPRLADLLEKAGCANQDILHHCRQPGEHARGCWVIDLVLGKTSGPIRQRTPREREKLQQMLQDSPPLEGLPIIEIGDRPGQVREIPYEEVRGLMKGKGKGKSIK